MSDQYQVESETIWMNHRYFIDNTRKVLLSWVHGTLWVTKWRTP